MSAFHQARFGAIALTAAGLLVIAGAARADDCSEGFSGNVIRVSKAVVMNSDPGGWVVTNVSCDYTGGEAPPALPSPGSLLLSGTRITVHYADQLDLFDGYNEAEVVPGSTVAIGTTDETRLELVDGAIWVTSVKEKPQTRIGAPNLLAVAENAKFAVTTQPNDVSAVSPLSGRVTVTNIATGETKVVPLGSTAFVSHGAIDIKPTLVVESEKIQGPDPVWIMKAVTSDPPITLKRLPKPGTGVKVGTKMSTIDRKGAKITIELVNVNGRDRLVIMPDSVVTIGDNDPRTKRNDLSVLKGEIEVEVSNPSISVSARHLLATIANARCIVGVQATISTVSVEDGSVEVVSLLTGIKKQVPVGVTQVVRSANTAPITFPADAGKVEQMQ
jgi:hypothetical protein